MGNYLSVISIRDTQIKLEVCDEKRLRGVHMGIRKVLLLFK
jgi:hypothetical protein